MNPKSARLILLSRSIFLSSNPSSDLSVPEFSYRLVIVVVDPVPPDSR